MIDDLVQRSMPFRAVESGDGWVLTGYAAVFNTWTEITDKLGTYREQIAPCAFQRTLTERTPVMQFDHGTHPMLGSLPLGKIEALREDTRGLFVRALLSNNWMIQPVRDAIAVGGITGMSFKFRIIADRWTTGSDGVDQRTIVEVDLFELGPVVQPAYRTTTVGVS